MKSINKQFRLYVVCVGGVREPEIDRIFVFWSPEACIADSMTDDGLSKVVSGNTQVSWRLCENVRAVHTPRPICMYLPVMCKSIGVAGGTRNPRIPRPTINQSINQLIFIVAYVTEVTSRTTKVLVSTIVAVRTFSSVS